ncbi:unnamed protein product [Candida verbasci]|uniref:Bem2p n=1 Tax=Candida verbasci TaxID=1227364 RepID=A0A9W4TXV8_9ASCO|nr:unnamed protein product [Candida verbasci]
MRKIWSRKDKDKRKSLSNNLLSINSSNSNLNSVSYSDSSSRDDLSIKQVNNDYDHQSSIPKDNKDDLNSIQTDLTNSTTAYNGNNFNAYYNDKFTSINSNNSSTFLNHHSGKSSISATATTTTTATATTYTPSSANSLSNYEFSSLVEPDYDSKLIKNNWINGVLNNTEINESNLKLLRAELKGSYLYLYKPNSSLNIKNFKLNNDLKDFDEINSISEQTLNDSLPTIRKNSVFESNSISTVKSKPFKIYYQKTNLPHPELSYDFDSHVFINSFFNNGKNSLESIIHFLLFAMDPSDSHSVKTIIQTLPILPNFNETLTFISQYLELIFKGAFEGSYNKDLIQKRVLEFLNHIQQHFDGYLLKSDTAPSILKILEIISIDNNNDVSSFKQIMLQKQQTLIDLLNNTTQTSHLPFQYLNSEYFLKKINLIDFAKSISEVDLKFFKNWNSNIDKSLLLSSSINCDEYNKDSFYKKNPLIFNNDYHIHYLSRLLINHLFIENQSKTSSLEYKARLLEKWIDLGCLLDKSGNMSSWLGISSIILSLPILRLTKIWSLVSQDYIKLLKNDWSPVLFELDRRYLVNETTHIESSNNGLGESNIKDSYHIMAPRGLGKIYPREKVIPYFGDLVIKNNIENCDVYELESVWKKINYSFDRWNDYLNNLNNFDDIIRYNDDVLRRYDSMGFIFSNESLNQVLYLGVNNGSIKENNQPRIKETRDYEMESVLLSLIDLNCESFNLNKIMKYSLESEPELPENYLTKSYTNKNNSTISVNSIESESENDPSSKLPIFNNQYFKISLKNYDELVADGKKEGTPPPITVHNLVFSVDNFVMDTENKVNNFTIEDEEEETGLGIDVDNILNSEKFNTFPLSPNLRKQNSDKSLDESTKYIPKYATIDRLIDLLLLESEYFNEDVHIDLTEFRFVFLLNYSSFISTNELLNHLAYRFVNSGNAVVSIMHHQTDSIWTSDPTRISETDVDYSLLLKIQINILKVLILLLTNFYSNFSLDLNNKDKLIKLLRLFSNEILQWYNSNKIDNLLEKSFESLVIHYKKLKKLFVKKTYRPIEISKFDEYLTNEYKFNNSLHEVPSNRNLPSYTNILKVEKFLYKFNKVLTVFYKGIKAEDWIKIFKILENSFEKNNLLNYNLQKSNIPEDQMIISNIFHYFESLNERQLLLKQFPLVFRKLFKLNFKFKSYLLIQLTDSNITAEERIERMKTLLIMVKISKLKMDENLFVFEGKGNIPSCIETAIINVIYSPESRLYSSLWIKCCKFFDQNMEKFDDIDTILPKSVKLDDLQSSEPLLPCFGWIIENLIAINKCPSYYGQMINFNKRYLVFKLIKELSIEDPDEFDTYHDSKEFEFLLRLDETYHNDHHELIVFSDTKHGLFKEVLKMQYGILSIENKKKNHNEPMHTITKKTSNNSFKRQSLLYKTNSASRFKISGLFTKSRLSLGAERIINVDELPDPQVESKQKPVLILPLRNKKIFPVYIMPLCFKIDSDSNEEYFFQATNEDDLNDWLMKLNFANRHWFYSKLLNFKVTNNNITFGVPISYICKREQSSFPKFLQKIFEDIENNGLKDVGLYRISSSLSELNNTKSLIDKYGYLPDRQLDTHALTSLVKSYFRELPDALLTDEVITDFMKEKDGSIETYKIILGKLQTINYNTLRILIQHLNKISQFSEENKMTASNIATVIGPALTEASNLEILINNFGFMNLVLEKIILNFVEIFDDE